MNPSKKFHPDTEPSTGIATLRDAQKYRSTRTLGIAYWNPWIRITTTGIASRILGSHPKSVWPIWSAAGIRRISRSEILPGSPNQQRSRQFQFSVWTVVLFRNYTAVILYKKLSNPFNFIRRSSFTKLNIEINHLQTWITQPTQDEFLNKPRNLKGDDFSWKSIFQFFFQIFRTFVIKFQSRRNSHVSYVVQLLYNLENRVYM